jgi:hypothetical protein
MVTQNSTLFDERIIMAVTREMILWHEPQASGVIHPSE